MSAYRSTLPKRTVHEWRKQGIPWLDQHPTLLKNTVPYDLLSTLTMNCFGKRRSPTPSPPLRRSVKGKRISNPKPCLGSDPFNSITLPRPAATAAADAHSGAGTSSTPLQSNNDGVKRVPLHVQTSFSRTASSDSQANGNQEQLPLVARIDTADGTASLHFPSESQGFVHRLACAAP